MFNIFSSQNHAVYDVMYKEYCRTRQATDGNIIPNMRLAFWIPKALRMCNTYCFSAAKIVTQISFNVTSYVCLSLILPRFQRIIVSVFLLCPALLMSLIDYS